MSDQVQLAQALAFLYLTFGHVTDGVLTPEEMRTLAARVHERVPSLPQETIALVLRQIVDLYKTMGSAEQKLAAARDQAHQLRHHVDDATRSAIMGDLVEIAKADGFVSDEELAFIDELSTTLGVQRSH
ncbi:MAG: TerB family tellurite resistance protein [Myxococcales bacterium]|nr:TerB family tellurite resistance protein [Myxococcales bacterium]MCB9716735.1 TerB family tellurite resistance protein [Myxococcales bacterium]